jgi:hypothetical protein
MNDIKGIGIVGYGCNVKMEIGAVFGVVIRSEIMIAPSFASIIQESRVG